MFCLVHEIRDIFEEFHMAMESTLIEKATRMSSTLIKTEFVKGKSGQIKVTSKKMHSNTAIV